MSKDTSAWKRKFMKELLRERGGEADQEEGGLKTLLKDSTQQSLGLDARRRIELPSDELSLTRRAGGHLLPDDDESSMLFTIIVYCIMPDSDDRTND